MVLRACLFAPAYCFSWGKHIFSSQKHCVHSDHSFLYFVYSLSVFDIVSRVGCFSAKTQAPSSFQIPLFVRVTDAKQVYS